MLYHCCPWFSDIRSTILDLINLGIPPRYPTGCTQIVSRLTICGYLKVDLLLFSSSTCQYFYERCIIT